jgi:hypothetical protein
MSTKPTQSTAAKPVYKGKKKSNFRDYNYKAKEDTKPLNECSEQELIAEGSRPPFVRHISFEKTVKERAQLTRVHSCKKGPTGGFVNSNPVGIPHLLVVHVENKKKEKHFKTTHSFIVRGDEVALTITTFFGGNVKKAFFNGRPYKLK